MGQGRGAGKKHLKPPTVAPVKPIAGPSPLTLALNQLEHPWYLLMPIIGYRSTLPTRAGGRGNVIRRSSILVPSGRVIITTVSSIGLILRMP